MTGVVALLLQLEIAHTQLCFKCKTFRALNNTTNDIKRFITTCINPCCIEYQAILSVHICTTKYQTIDVAAAINTID